MTQRTCAEVQADMEQLDWLFEEAKTGLKTTPNDPRRGEWLYTVSVYRGKQANLIAELHKANRRALA